MTVASDARVTINPAPPTNTTQAIRMERLRRALGCSSSLSRLRNMVVDARAGFDASEDLAERRDILLRSCALTKEQADSSDAHGARGEAGLGGVEIDAAQQDLIAARARLAELEDQMKHLVGQTRKVPVTVAFDAHVSYVDALKAFEQAVRLSDGRPVELHVRNREAARGPMAERIRKALDRPVSLTIEAQGVEAILRLLSKEAPDLVRAFLKPSLAVQVRREAVRALAVMAPDSKTARAALEEVRFDPDLILRRSALEALNALPR